jgi:peptidoglycan/xylan/chitin deacetylase (PgdA/CDA1 family)
VTSYVTEGRALERARPLQLRARHLARRAALTALTALPRRPTEGVRIVHYHYVFEDERESFARQIAFLTSTFEPVSLSEAVARLREGRAGGREVVVTFDDGFSNSVTIAAPVLAEHGVRACFFLITGLVGSTGDGVWQERLHLPVAVEPMSWEQLPRLVELGHEVGSHTRTHPNLAKLSRDQLEEELRASREELVRHVGPVAHLSAPYGDAARFSARVSRAARDAGYASCATAIRGRNTRPDDVWALRRDHLVASWPVRDVRWFLA